MKRLVGSVVSASLLLWGRYASTCYADAPLPGVASAGAQVPPPPGGRGVSYYPGYISNPMFRPAVDAAPSNGSTIAPPLSEGAPAGQGVRQTSATAVVPPGTLTGPALQPRTTPESVPPPAASGMAPGATGPGGTLAAGAQPYELKLAPAPLETGDVAFPINLATALRLADARPLVVNAAQAAAWVAEAQLQRAKVLWVPDFNAGSDYIRHDGFGPDFNRGLNTNARPLNQNVNFLYSGIGFTMDVAAADAIFQPLVARQNLNSKRWNIQTAKNDALMQTAIVYFNVHQYRGQYAGTLDVVARGRKLVERISLLSQDLVPRVEVDRATRLLADEEQRAAMARQTWRTASADLTQILRLDPRVVVVPQEHDHLQVTLIDPNRSLDDLIPIGLLNRPELASQKAMVKSVAEAIRREKGRVLLPSLMMNGFQTPNELIEFGAQGIGADRSMNNWSLRDDLSPQAMWQFTGMGFGNMAQIKEQRGLQSQAIVEQFRIQDAVAGDVTRAQARLQSAAVRVIQAERSMRAALITYEGNFEGLAQTKRFDNVLIQIYRPQEVVIALEHLSTAYDQYFSTVADYNRAQFELFRALGYPAKEVSALHAVGEVAPVDTGRPAYLPAVGEGPPPATR